MLNGETVAAVVEARMTSSRLPGKVLMPANETPLLQVLLERLRQVERLDKIIVATTINATDDPIIELVDQLDWCDYSRGSEHDVLDRVSSCLKEHDVDVCVEITGDCPLVDPQIVHEVIQCYADNQPDTVYTGNTGTHSAVPAGFDVQVFSASALHQLADETEDPDDREHVSYGFYRPESNNRWHPKFVSHPQATEGIGMIVTLDYLEDYNLIREIYENLVKINPHFGVADVIKWIQTNPELHQACIDVRNNTP